MISAIIATRESERTLVPTLAALVPGITAGILTHVRVSDAESRDETRIVADLAGCEFVSSPDPVGIRLRQAADATRSPWLLFLRAGTVPEPAWIGAVERFIEAVQDEHRAAAFRRPPALGIRGLLAALRRAGPDQGLLISRAHYLAAGGHAPHDDAERALLSKLGRRLVTLQASALPPRKGAQGKT